MIQEIFELDEDFNRPVMRIKSLKSIKALLDTGAQFPVWVDDARILETFGAKLIKSDVKFGGFGKGAAVGDLYVLPILKLGNILYPHLHIIACKKDCKYNLIISATMFKNYIYTIDDKNHKLTIDIPDGESNVKNLVIRAENDKLYVLCSGVDESRYT